MENKHWIHIRTHDLCETLYVDGKQVLSDDSLSASQVLEVILPLISDTIMFSTDNVVETEEDELEFNDIFPYTMSFDDIGKFEAV